MIPSLVCGFSLLALGSATISHHAPADKRNGRAVDFQEGLLFRGVKEQRRNFFFGAAAFGHDVSDPPPSLFSTDDTCRNDCNLVVPKIVNRSGDQVMIRWFMNGTKSWNSSDFIGLYEIGAPNHNYIDWIMANNDVTGFGQRTLKLYNLRSKLQFRYLAKTLAWYSCICASVEFDFALGASEPTQGHLSLTTDPTSMQLTWVSGDASGGFVEVQGLPNKFFSQVDRYLASDMCGPPANTSGPWAFRDVGYIHTAAINGLKGDATYKYRYGQNNITTDWFEFTTEPASSNEWTAVTFGDMGIAGHDDTFYDQMWGAKLVQIDILARAPRLVVHFGDLSYARSVGFVWDVWGNQISEIAHKVPYMVSLGNHEYDHVTGGDNDPSGAGVGFHPSWGNYGDDSAGECGVPVVKRFPNPPATGNGIFWYSYNFANVHWVMLSSEHNYTTEAAQYIWLDKDLSKVDRSKTPWVIVTAHRPAYNSEMYASDYKVALNMARNLDDMLVKHKVNLFLAGHYHAYQRQCAVAHMECHGQVSSPSAPVHITVGSAGATLDDAKDYPEDSSWTMRTMDTYGTLVLRIRPDKIIGEFWGAENNQAPALPFGLLDTFEVFPFSGTGESLEYV